MPFVRGALRRNILAKSAGKATLQDTSDRFVTSLAMRRAVIAALLAAATIPVSEAHDRVASIAQARFSTESDTAGPHWMLINLVHALDRVTNSSTKIVLRPFARSLEETAAGLADFHLPLIQSGDTPAPQGLAYVSEVDFGPAYFVIYSRKQEPLNAATLPGHRVEAEPGHGSLFPFPVNATQCLPCSLDKVLLARADALIGPSEVIDPLLADPKYRDIHRALYKSYPVRALVPVRADSSATRRYLIEGVKRLKETGEFWKITHHDLPYSDWQP